MGPLAAAIRIAAFVPILAGAGGAVLGTGLLGEQGGAATDSHLRYLSGVLLGLGVLAIWCAADLRHRARIFEALCAAVALGGLARLAGLAVSVPPWPHLLALGMELGVVPALWVWCRRASRG